MNDELPEELKQMQDKINEYYKEQSIKKQIGKYYSRHDGPGYPVELRRIYRDGDNIRVDNYYSPHDRSEFKFKTWIITEALYENSQPSFREVGDPKVWYNCLQILSNTKQIKSIFISESQYKEN